MNSFLPARESSQLFMTVKLTLEKILQPWAGFRDSLNTNTFSTQNGIAEHLFCTVKITDSVQIRRLISNLQLLVTWKQETVGLQRRVGKKEYITQTKPWSTMIKLLRDHKVKDFNNETALYHQQLSHNYTSSLPLTLVHKAVSISSTKEVTSARSTDININSAWWRKKHQQPLVY